ncbi:hypothetical protein ACFWAY_51770 [Rhodococcus sp. NPDC059968]
MLSIRDAAGLPEEISVPRVFDVIACRCRPQIVRHRW